VRTPIDQKKPSEVHPAGPVIH